MPRRIFDGYVLSLYDQRCHYKSQEHKREDLVQLFKLLLNSLYGKFGQKDFGMSKLVHEDNLDEFLLNPCIIELSQITDKLYRIQFAT